MENLFNSMKILYKNIMQQEYNINNDVI